MFVECQDLAKKLFAECFSGHSANLPCHRSPPRPAAHPPHLIPTSPTPLGLPPRPHIASLPPTTLARRRCPAQRRPPLLITQCWPPLIPSHRHRCLASSHPLPVPPPPILSRLPLHSVCARRRGPNPLTAAPDPLSGWGGQTGSGGPQATTCDPPFVSGGSPVLAADVLLASSQLAWSPTPTRWPRSGTVVEGKGPVAAALGCVVSAFFTTRNVPISDAKKCDFCHQTRFMTLVLTKALRH
jgi:hypothetical protein